MPVYNAPCDAGFYYNDTLGTLREDLLIRLGYAAQTNNPPPGMTMLLNNFLQRGQNFLYRRYRALQTERYFHWTMAVGERFYAVLDNEAQDDPTCTRKLHPERITGAWVEDLNGAWLPLSRGINAGYFATVTQPGIPCCYEIRQNIEVYPAPSAAYTLHIKGHFGLSRFTEDDDQCTVDSELLFLWALANAKNHYGQPDAADIATEAQTMLGTLVADSHGDARYIPGAAAPAPMVRPTMTAFDD
jgi:hypothetical protein